MPKDEAKRVTIGQTELEPIEHPIITRANPAPEPVFPTYPRFWVTSLPISVTYQPDSLRQFYRGGVPQQRIIPLGK